jgi:hypothetical protein
VIPAPCRPRAAASRAIQAEVRRLESDLGPLEFAGRMEEEGELGQALRTSVAGAFLSGAGEPQPFARRVLAPGASLYSAAGGAAERALLVGFCGRADRLMLPLPVVLQHLPARDWDLLLLRDSHKAHYRGDAKGWPAASPNWPGAWPPWRRATDAA